MNQLTIRPAIPSDWPQLRQAVIELQEHERRLHSTRLPGEQIADAYLKWMKRQAREGGPVLVAKIQSAFVGFVAGWIEQERNIAETENSNRFGYISDICVLPAYRGQRFASRLLDALDVISQQVVHGENLRFVGFANRHRLRRPPVNIHNNEILYEKIIRDQDAS